LAELVPDPLRRPGGLDGIGVAQVKQPPIGHAADVGAVDRAEGGEGLVPGGAQVRGGRASNSEPSAMTVSQLGELQQPR